MIVKGKIRLATPKDIEDERNSTPISPCSDFIDMDGEDFYKELRIRGYQYKYLLHKSSAGP